MLLDMEPIASGESQLSLLDHLRNFIVRPLKVLCRGEVGVCLLRFCFTKELVRIAIWFSTTLSVAFQMSGEIDSYWN
jgi:hypothetical protein